MARPELGIVGNTCTNDMVSIIKAFGFDEWPKYKLYEK